MAVVTGQWPPQQPGQPDPWPGAPQYPAGPPQMPGQPGQYPAPPPASEQKPIPADVQTAFQLWFAVAALGVVYLVAALLFVYSDRTSFVDQLMDEFAKQPDVTVTRSQAEQLLVFGLVSTGVILTLVLGGLTVLFDFKMRKGKNWARMLLTMAGAFTVLSAIPTVFGAGAATGTAALVMGGAGILQAVVAVGAIVLMHRKESNEYFLNLPVVR
ncbi:putative membrane channel-forming protein YqfA (hemolysin III family) [Prescottella agglutinans]|uniref:Membrane channel-forming protein YqfA (Hemolysin III family) n=1 Tax=Prescottella agglutinans TaxID=1644129 RepID=A0ABT6M5C4_9NOCA|nr:putative membrane channel-forming protein YqfA (hemolysin III family) [Prescottella agglutinans]